VKLVEDRDGDRGEVWWHAVRGAMELIQSEDSEGFALVALKLSNGGDTITPHLLHCEPDEERINLARHLMVLAARLLDQEEDDRG
jgi:hypothetical protein